MALTQLLPTLHALSPYEKMQIIQALSTDLLNGSTPHFQADRDYPIWSPLDANEAASALVQLLENERKQP